VPRPAPCIDGIQVKITCVGVGLRKSTGKQVWQFCVELRGVVEAKSAGGLLGWNVSRFYRTKAHGLKPAYCGLKKSSTELPRFFLSLGVLCEHLWLVSLAPRHKFT
jgi:hypothetical protein